ncbi:MAG: hypothetical protein M0R50_06630 [Candidatus Cloacimonetes bacterium]|jgi:uncharacterized lipoprotein YehR (DUF1307 family)|nr:hypothetical protein [Candidatus Cloacimonadota bacterium]
MNKKSVIKVITIVLVLVCVLSLTGCGPKTECKDAVLAFQAAANACDVAAMLDSMSRDTVKTLRGNKSVEEYIASKTTDELLAQIVNILAASEIENPREFLETFTLDYDNTDIRDNYAALYGIVTYTQNGELVTTDTIFNLARENVSQPWKVSGIAL